MKNGRTVKIFFAYDVSKDINKKIDRALKLIMFFSIKKFTTDKLKKIIEEEGLRFVEKFKVGKWERINDEDDSDGYHVLVDDDFDYLFLSRKKPITDLNELTQEARWALEYR